MRNLRLSLRISLEFIYQSWIRPSPTSQIMNSALTNGKKKFRDAGILWLAVDNPFSGLFLIWKCGHAPKLLFSINSKCWKRAKNALLYCYYGNVKAPFMWQTCGVCSRKHLARVQPHYIFFTTSFVRENWLENRSNSYVWRELESWEIPSMALKRSEQVDSWYS